MSTTVRGVVVGHARFGLNVCGGARQPLSGGARPQSAGARKAEQNPNPSGAVVVVYVQSARLRRVRAERAVSVLRGEQARVVVVADAERLGAGRLPGHGWPFVVRRSSGKPRLVLTWLNFATTAAPRLSPY